MHKEIICSVALVAAVASLAGCGTGQTAFRSAGAPATPGSGSESEKARIGESYASQRAHPGPENPSPSYPASDYSPAPFTAGINNEPPAPPYPPSAFLSTNEWTGTDGAVQIRVWGGSANGDSAVLEEREGPAESRVEVVSAPSDDGPLTITSASDKGSLSLSGKSGKTFTFDAQTRRFS